MWGLNVADGKSKNETFGPVFFGDSEAEPNPGKFEDIRNDRTTAEVFAQEQWYLTTQLSLLAGAQYVYARRASRVDVPTPPTFFPIFFPRDERQSYDGFSPKLGAIWEFASATQVFANISRSYEPPTSFEFFSSSGGNALKAQSAWTAEIGTRGRTERSGWELAFYRAWVKHEILSIEIPPNSGQFQTSNVNDTTHLGIEASVSSLVPLGFTALDDALDVKLAYTWNHFRFNDNPRFGNKLPGIPEHVLNLEALYRHPAGFFFGPNLQLASSWFAD